MQAAKGERNVMPHVASGCAVTNTSPAALEGKSLARGLAFTNQDCCQRFSERIR